MATIPQVIDYGARPSLRTGRVDVPGTGDIAVAEAIERAAGTFTQVMVERKEKQDAFNYNMAKQEYLTADLAEREKLKDDRDYDTFDERYSTGLGKERDRITSKYQLTPHDRAIFDAEADLIRERGRASVGEFRRRVMIDDKLSDLDGSLLTAREKAIIAPPGERNEILLTALDQINAAEDDLILSEVDAETKRQELVQDVATASLVHMEPDEREKVLEASLAYRETTGPLTPDDIRGGKGTGSIADFLHADTATKMLRATQKENELETTQRDAYIASDSGWDIFPEEGQDAERRAHIRELTKDDPKARKAALEANRLRQASKIRSTALEHQDIMSDMMDLVEQGETYSSLPPGPMGKLTAAERKVIDDFSVSTHERDGFADYNEWDAQQAWADMSAQERADADLDGFIPTDPNLADQPQIKWKSLLTRKEMELMQAQQRVASESIKSGSVEAGLTQTQAFENMLLATPYFDHRPTSTSKKEYQDRWSRMMGAYHTRVINAGIEEGKLSPTRKYEIMGEVLRFEVFVAKDFATDQRYPLSALSDEQVKKAYIPLDEPLGPSGLNAYTTQIKVPATENGPAFSGYAYTWLNTVGKTLDPNGEYPDEELLEQAYFYLVTDGVDAAIRQLSSPERY